MCVEVEVALPSPVAVAVVVPRKFASEGAECKFSEGTETNEATLVMDKVGTRPLVPGAFEEDMFVWDNGMEEVDMVGRSLEKEETGAEVSLFSGIRSKLLLINVESPSNDNDISEG